MVKFRKDIFHKCFRYLMHTVYKYPATYNLCKVTLSASTTMINKGQYAPASHSNEETSKASALKC